VYCIDGRCQQELRKEEERADYEQE
jgi:hypothetical protein